MHCLEVPDSFMNLRQKAPQHLFIQKSLNELACVKNLEDMII